MKQWVHDHAAEVECTKVVFADGSTREFETIAAMMVLHGSLTALPMRRNCFLARSHHADVARVEARTFICAPNVGVLNNYAPPIETREKLHGLFKGSARGRTLYAITFRMGPKNSPYSKLAVQLTDSPYVLLAMHIMNTVAPFEELAETVPSAALTDWIKLTHSMGVPLGPTDADLPWPCNPSALIIAHFPLDREVISFGSGYGGNALLGKKCLSLRLGSVMGYNEGWLAEHMAIIGVQDPKGVKRYMAIAAPSGCGKTAFATLVPTLPGWKVTLVGDDIAWLHFDTEGHLRAVNPETGLFGIAPGTSAESPAGISCREDSIFTNVALTADKDIYYEGYGKPPRSASSWLRRDWVPSSAENAAHPNSRFITRAATMPNIDANWRDPNGVPIHAIIFATRRDETVPLIVQSVDWADGVLAAATMASRATATSEVTVGSLKPDPMAMRPFIGYAVGEYFKHWLKVPALQARAAGNSPSVPLPRIFRVNVFRKGKDGRVVWPGFGDNIRLLKWIMRGELGKDSVATPVGLVPAPGALDVTNLEINAEALRYITAVNPDEWALEQARAMSSLKTMDAPSDLIKACEAVSAKFGFVLNEAGVVQESAPITPLLSSSTSSPRELATKSGGGPPPSIISPSTTPRLWNVVRSALPIQRPPNTNSGANSPRSDGKGDTTFSTNLNLKKQFK